MIISQGESYPIFVTLTMDGQQLTPDLVADVEVCFAGIRRTYSTGGFLFDETRKQWWLWPTQEETLAAKPGPHSIAARVKFPGNPNEVLEITLGRILIKRGRSKEIL